MAKNRILAKLVMVVEVLAAEHRSEYALAHQRPNPVLDKPRVTPIGEAAGKSPHQPKTPVQLLQQPRTRIRCDRPAIETATTARSSTASNSNSFGVHSVCIRVLSSQLFEKSRLTPCELTYSGVLMRSNPCPARSPGIWSFIGPRQARR
jgi:hypothetical protein